MAEYIERDAAIEAALSCTDSFEPIEVDITVENVVSKLRKLPIADVQPVKHGRWSGYLCSNCGISKYNFISFNFDDQNGYARPFGTWNYCPRCGTRMDSNI